MPEQVWLGHFNIVGGQVQEDGPFAAAVADRHAADTIADLYTTLQPTRPDPDQLCPGLMEAIGKTFGHAQYSVTGNLLLALGQAHHDLREWNRTSLPEHRLGIGISCMAITGDEAYIAQAGPSVAFYRHHGRVERLEPLEREAQRPLGEAESLDPWFHRLKLEQGDSILLLSGDNASQADPRLIATCLALSPEQGLPHLYRAVAREDQCGALLISVIGDLSAQDDDDDDAPDRATAAPLYPQAAATGSQGAAPAPPARPKETPPSGGLTPRPPARGEPRAGTTAPPPGHGHPEVGREGDAPLAEPPLKPEKPRRAPSPLGRNPFRRVAAEHPDEGRGVLRVIGAEKPRRPHKGPTHALATAEDVLAAAARVTRTNIRVRDKSPGFRTAFHGLGGRRRSPRPFLLGGAALAALALALWLGIPAVVNSTRSQRFNTLLHSAQTELTSATAETDLSKRRELLNQALSNVDEARRLRPQDQRAVSEASSVADALSVLDAVFQLADVPTIASLSAAGLSPSSTVEVAVGAGLYVLDVSSGKVFSVSRDPALPPDVVYEDGSAVDGVNAGKGHHIAWQPANGAGEQGTLLILDAGHHLFGLTAGDLRAIPLRGVEQWKSDTALAFSGGNLYVLDAAAGLVWRYAPSGSGFDTDPAPAVARADIRDATGMSIVGGIFLTGQDGRIRRFLDGQEGTFKLAGIDKAPAAPQPPLYDAATGALYIADRANSRIVVIEADGRFKRQLTHVRLAGLRGVAIDPVQNRLVGVVGQSLVAIPLPR